MLETRFQKLVMILIVLTGVCSGFDIGVISGTLPAIKQELSLDYAQLSEIAGIVFFGALLSKLVSGFLMDLLSRKNVIAIGSFVFSVSMILMMISNTFNTLMLSRLLQGISVGFLLTVVPIYIAETSIARFRGRAIAIFQLALVSGIFVANFFASLFVDKYGWRFIFGCALPFSIGLFAVSLLAPFSPSWLMLKGRGKLALSIGEQLALNIAAPVTQEKISFVELIRIVFKNKYYISIIMISIMAVLNGFVGINTFISFGPTIFDELSGCTQCGASYYGTAMTFVNLIATLIGLLLVDVIGRRKLIMGGLFISFISMVLACYLKTGSSHTILTLILLIIVVFGGAVGPGVGIWLILSEVLPVQIRAMGISIALVSKALIESIFISRFLEFTSSYGFASIFYFMAVCTLVFIFMVYKFLPEMTNKELI